MQISDFSWSWPFDTDWPIHIYFLIFFSAIKHVNLEKIAWPDLWLWIIVCRWQIKSLLYQILLHFFFVHVNQAILIITRVIWLALQVIQVTKISNNWYEHFERSAMALLLIQIPQTVVSSDNLLLWSSEPLLWRHTYAVNAKQGNFLTCHFRTS